MQKYFILSLVLLIFFLAFVPPAAASFCRNYNGNNICILNIKRSAKYPWEYRAAVRINGVARPVEIYNCRTEEKMQKNGKIVKFKPNGAGKLICSVLNK